MQLTVNAVQRFICETLGSSGEEEESSSYWKSIIVFVEPERNGVSRFI